MAKQTKPRSKAKPRIKNRSYKGKGTMVKKPSPVINRTQAVFGLGLPKSAVVTHKYHSFIQLTSIGGATANYQFTCNGLFDPDITGAGHQPMYFDQLSAIYNHYTVIGSRISYRISHGNTANGPIVVNSFINDDNTIAAVGDSLSEQSTSKSRTIPTGSNNMYYLTNKWSAKKTFKGGILSNYLFRGDASNNPPEASLFTLTAYEALGGTATINVEVNIEYVAIWQELRDLAGS